MSNTVETVEFTFMTKKELRELFDRAVEGVKSKKSEQIVIETLDGLSSFNVYIAPLDMWWIEEQFDSDKEIIENLYVNGLLDKRARDELLKEGVYFSMTTMTEFDSNGVDLGTYTLMDIEDDKEAVFKKFVEDYQEYLADMWEGFEAVF